MQSKETSLSWLQDHKADLQNENAKLGDQLTEAYSRDERITKYIEEYMSWVSGVYLPARDKYLLWEALEKYAHDFGKGEVLPGITLQSVKDCIQFDKLQYSNPGLIYNEQVARHIENYRLLDPALYDCQWELSIGDIKCPPNLLYWTCDFAGFELFRVSIKEDNASWFSAVNKYNSWVLDQPDNLVKQVKILQNNHSIAIYMLDLFHFHKEIPSRRADQELELKTLKEAFGDL